MSCRVVVASQMRVKDVVAEVVPVGTGGGGGMAATGGGLVSSGDGDLVVGLDFLLPSLGGVVVVVTAVFCGCVGVVAVNGGLAPSACIHAHPQSTYTGVTAYFTHQGRMSNLKT